MVRPRSLQGTESQLFFRNFLRSQYVVPVLYFVIVGHGYISVDLGCISTFGVIVHSVL